MKHHSLSSFFVRIPARISNRIVIGFLECLRFLQTIVQHSWNHEAANRTAFRNHRMMLRRAGGFIEIQNHLSDMQYGNYTVQYCGCEVIALYNALLSLSDGRQPDFCALLTTLEHDGILLNGKFGTSPRAIYDLLCRSSFPVTWSTDRTVFEQIASQSDALILTMYNDCEDVTEQVHTVCITKTDDAYIAHNVSGNGRVTGPSSSLSALVRSFHCGRAREISLIGLNRKAVSPGSTS